MGRIECREKCVADRFEILMTNHRENNALDSVPGVLSFAAAVDRDAMAAGDQPRAELRGEGLEAAIARRNASRSEDADPQRRPLTRRFAAPSPGFAGRGISREVFAPPAGRRWPEAG